MNKQAVLWGLLTVLIWGSGFAGIRMSLLGGYPAGHLVLVRFLIASSLFVLVALIPSMKFRLPDRQDYGKLLLLSLIGITVYQLGVTFGEETVTAGVAALLIGATPILTALFATIILKERIRPVGYLGLVIGLFGIVLISGGASGEQFELTAGAIYLLIAAVATSLFFVYQKPFLKKYRAIELTAYVTWLGTLPFLFFLPGLTSTLQQASVEAHWAALYVGIFPAAIAYVTWAKALSYGEAGAVTSLMYLEPIIGLFFAWFLLQELPPVLAFIGGGLAICSVFLFNLSNKKQKARK